MKEKRLTIACDEKLHKKVRREALKRDETLRQFIENLLDDYFKKYSPTKEVAEQ